MSPGRLLELLLTKVFFFFLKGLEPKKFASNNAEPFFPESFSIFTMGVREPKTYLCLKSLLSYTTRL